MKNNPVIERTKEESATEETKSRPFSFSRFFSRNGHHKPAEAPKQVGPKKSVLREYFESAVARKSGRGGDWAAGSAALTFPHCRRINGKSQRHDRKQLEDTEFGYRRIPLF